LGNKDHECIQQDRLKRIEKKQDKQDGKFDKIMAILSENRAKLDVVLARLDTKEEHDQKINGNIEKKEERMDNLENIVSKLSIVFIFLGVVATLVLGLTVFIVYNHIKF
jgi:hypothetical protein